MTSLVSGRLGYGLETLPLGDGLGKRGSSGSRHIRRGLLLDRKGRILALVLLLFMAQRLVDLITQLAVGVALALDLRPGRGKAGLGAGQLSIRSGFVGQGSGIVIFALGHGGLGLLELVLRKTQVHRRVIGGVGIAGSLQLHLGLVHDPVRRRRGGAAGKRQRECQRQGRNRQASTPRAPEQREKDVHHHSFLSECRSVLWAGIIHFSNAREIQGIRVDIGYFLKLMVDKGASDMFLTTGAPVNIKVEGKLYPLGNTGLPSGMVKKIAYSLMDEGQVPQFERDLELNMALAVKEAGRFRINVFKQRGEVGMVIRAIKSEIPSVDQLQLPGIFRELIMEPRGLILVVGATGSGKSTTLAAMIDHRNQHSSGHILTIEDPIEYLHRHKRSIVNQREVGLDTHSYHEALRNAMREAPDVIMIGEIRDTDTMEAAIAFSETGHLCLATLHSNNADQTLERILNFFPESAHKNVLMNLALNLRAVISQRLVVGKDGRRLPATEVLLNTPLIRDMIRRGQVHDVKEAMDRSLQEGMQTFDQSLYRLYKEGRIELDEALNKADSRDGLSLKIRLSEGSGSESTELVGNDPYGLGF